MFVRYSDFFHICTQLYCHADWGAVTPGKPKTPVKPGSLAKMAKSTRPIPAHTFYIVLPKRTPTTQCTTDSFEFFNVS